MSDAPTSEAEAPQSGATESSPPPATEAAAAPPAAKKPAPPAQRPLPTFEGIAAWIEGDDSVPVGALFERRVLKTFDILMMQIKKDELLPQHWQVISSLQAPPDEEFDSLPEVGKLRVRYKDQELSRRRLGALRTGWRELRGKRPGLWTVADLFAAIRRIIEKKLDVDYDDLLAAQRDVWRGMSLPFGRQQLDALWANLHYTRDKTKK